MGTEISLRPANLQIAKWVREAGYGVEEIYWRGQSANNYARALLRGSAALSDYRDWVEPHLQSKFVLAGDDHARFWFIDVKAENVPMNRITGLVSYQQMQGKYSHGNAYDSLHANYILHADVFVTADQGFHAVLTQIREHVNEAAEVLFVNRAAESAYSEIEEALASLGRN
jgi:hypothetical protein